VVKVFSRKQSPVSNKNKPSDRKLFPYFLDNIFKPFPRRFIILPSDRRGRYHLFIIRAQQAIGGGLYMFIPIMDFDFISGFLTQAITIGLYEPVKECPKPFG